MSNLVSIEGKKGKKGLVKDYVRIVYTTGEIEILQSDSWGEAGELTGFLIFLRSIDKDTDDLVGFRNSALIVKIDMLTSEEADLCSQ
jgi:hypothetical protein